MSKGTGALFRSRLARFATFAGRALFGVIACVVFSFGNFISGLWCNGILGPMIYGWVKVIRGAFPLGVGRIFAMLVGFAYFLRVLSGVVWYFTLFENISWHFFMCRLSDLIRCQGTHTLSHFSEFCYLRGICVFKGFYLRCCGHLCWYLISRHSSC